MDRNRHRLATLDYFRTVAVRRAGFYDARAGGPLRHSVWQRRVRRRIDRSLSADLRPGDTVVDIGCGNGDLVGWTAPRHPDVRFLGVDLSAEMIDVARSRTESIDNVECVTGDLLGLPPERGPFDVVLCLNALHHLHRDDLDAALERLANLTKRTLLVELKNVECHWNRWFRRTDEFPVSLIDPRHAIARFDAHGLRCLDRWNIFRIGVLSPIVVLEFGREG